MADITTTQMLKLLARIWRAYLFWFTATCVIEIILVSIGGRRHNYGKMAQTLKLPLCEIKL